jgi:hypothetical protein
VCSSDLNADYLKTKATKMAHFLGDTDVVIP